jgi:hypothetical protein
MKLEDTHLMSGTALLPYLERRMKLRQERSILYQTPKAVKENHPKSSTIYHTVTHRPERRLFSRNESVNVDNHTETSLLHFSVDDSLGLEITGNYYIFLSYLCIVVGNLFSEVNLLY